MKSKFIAAWLGATIVVMLAIYGAMHIVVVRIRPTSIDPAIAAMVGVIAGMSIWGVVLSVLRRRRLDAVLFALLIPGLLLIPSLLRDPARSEWPITLVVAMVAGAVMVWRLYGPTRQLVAAEANAAAGNTS